MAVCNDCHVEFDPRAPGTWHEVTGWVESRPTQGLKGNALHGKTFTGNVRCPECGKLRRLGATVGQESLF